MNKLIEKLKRNRVAAAATGAALLVLILLLAILARPPRFPEDDVSKKSPQEALQDRKSFFKQFTDFLEKNHGGLLNTEQLNPKPDAKQLQAPGIYTFRQQFRFLHQSLTSELAQEFAEERNMKATIRLGCNGYQTDITCHQLDFSSNNQVWLRVQLESVRLSYPEKGKKSEYIDRVEINGKEKLPAGKTGKARLAIVIDDFGYRIDVFNDFITLDFDITYAILPQQAYSRETAERATQAGREVMLHMPMQPKDWPRFDPGLGALLVEDSPTELRTKIALNLETVPFVNGINNHMGSAYTQDEQGLDILMRGLNENGLFFLDSKTAPGRMARDAAARYDVPYLSRDIFLDNDKDEILIEKQLDKAARLARKRGWAIAIGHAYSITYTVLARQLPRLQEQGITVTRVDDLVN